MTPEEAERLKELEAKYGESPEMPDLQTALAENVGSPVVDFMKRAALPTAAGAAGTVLGGRLPLVGPAVKRAATPLLEAGLSATGEFANQAFGITPPDPTDVALAGGFPLAARGGGAAWRAAVSSGFLPGSAGGLKELAAEAAGELVQKIRPTTNPDAAWEQARSFTPILPARNFLKAVKSLRQNEEILQNVPSLQYGSLTKLLDEMEAVIDPVSETVDLRTFDAMRKRLGEWSRGLKGPEQGAYRKAYGAILDDVEASVTHGVWAGPTTRPAVEALKVAMSATRRDLAADALEESITRSIFVRSGDNLVTFRANQVLNDLNKSKGMEPYRKALTKKDISKKEHDDLLDTLSAVNKIAAAPPAAGQKFGSGSVLIGYFAARGLLGAAGVSPEKAELIAMSGNAMAWLFSRALMTEAGRKYVKAVARGGGKWNQQTLGLLANITRAAAFSENAVDPSELPPALTQEVSLPPVLDVLPSVDMSQLPGAP